jgi:hypothetical protein
MADIRESFEGKGDWYLVSGGKPTYGWTGRAPNKFHPMQVRSFEPYHEAKGYTKRCVGLPDLFEPKSDIHQFKTNLHALLVERGLDTVTYLPDLSTHDDPSVCSDMINIVDEFTRFSSDKAKTIAVAREYASKFDSFDENNSSAAVKVLLNSLSTPIRTSLERKVTFGASFAEYWIQFISLQVPVSFDHYDKLKEQLKQADPTKYAQENITEMVDDLKPVVEVLLSAAKFEPSLTAQMLHSINSKVTPNHQFNYDMNGLMSEVKLKLKQVSFLDNVSANREMEAADLDPCTVLVRVADLHNEHVLDGNWEPANRKVDSGRVMVCDDSLDKVIDLSIQRAMIAIAKKASNGKGKATAPLSGRKCYECGDAGHLKPDCPKLKGKPKQPGGGDNFKKEDEQRSWRRIAPKEGERQTKKVNGRDHYWCQKCKRWNTTHSTSQHTKKKAGKEGSSSSFNPALAAALGMFQDDVADLGCSLVVPVENSAPDLTVLSIIIFALGLGAIVWRQNLVKSHLLTMCQAVVSYLALVFPSFRAVVGDWSTLFWTKTVSFWPFVCDTLPSAYTMLIQVNHLVCAAWIQHPWVFLGPCLWFFLFCFLCVYGPSSNTSSSNYVELRKYPPIDRKRRRLLTRWWKRAKLRLHRRLTRWLLGGSDPYEEESFRLRRLPGSRFKHRLKGRFRYRNRHRMNPAHHSVAKRSMREKALREMDALNFVVQDVKSPQRFNRVFPGRYKNHHNRTYHCHSAKPQVFTKSQLSTFLTPMFQSLRALLSTTADDGQFPLIWDSGSSVCISNNRDDFISYSTKVGTLVKAKKLGNFVNGDTPVMGEGHVLWYVPSVRGTYRALKLPAAHIPEAKLNLVSTQVVFDTYGEKFVCEGDGRLEGVEGDHLRPAVIVPRNRHSNLLVTMATRMPIGTPKAPSTSPAAAPSCPPSLHAMPILYPAVSTANANLSEAQKELLRWHQKLGHMGMSKVKFLLGTGALAQSEAAKRLHRSAASTSCLAPLCQSCIHAKQCVRTPDTRKKRFTVRDTSDVLKAGNLRPGQEISVDHFICSQKGRRFHTRGKEADKLQYDSGCLFVDHASNYIHVEFQTTTSSHATLESKTAFEAMCRDVGVVPLTYMTDSGSAFTSKAFAENLNTYRQLNKFAGTAAHNQNAIAERAIRTITSSARCMLIHAAVHWPEVSDTALWPMAVAHAVFLWNHVPNPSTGLSPADIFTRTRFPLEKLHDLHVFGCPAYVLDKKLADGKKLPRWTPRSDRCMYLGRADKYASSVYLVLNIATGSITPQYHVVLDDWFATVSASSETLPDFGTDAWQRLFGDSELQFPLDADDIHLLSRLNDDLENSVDTQRHAAAQDKVLEALHHHGVPLPLRQPKPVVVSRPSPSLRIPPSTGSSAMREPGSSALREPGSPVVREHLSSWRESVRVPVPAQNPASRADAPITLPRSSATPTAAPTGAPTAPRIAQQALPSPNPAVRAPPASVRRVSAPPVPVRRSSRLAEQNPRRSARIIQKNKALVTYCEPSVPPSFHFYPLFSAVSVPCYDDSFLSPSIFAAKKKSDPDLFSYHEAMRHPDREKWIEAMEKEIKELEEHGVWIEVPLSSAKNSKLVPCTWVFKIKRGPDGTIKKYKARICLRGDLMDNVGDVFAPVAHQATIRAFLMMSILAKHQTCSIDFSNAFVQAKNPYNTFMKCPAGFTTDKPNHCLKLLRSLYGATYSPKLWNQLCEETFVDMGFVQSRVDKCLYYKKNIFLILYVDDCGISYKNEEDLDEFINELQRRGFKLTKEGTFAEFLGIKYRTDQEGNIHLSQEGLIKKILETTGLTNCKPNRTPGRKEPLGLDPDGPPMAEAWSYPSVVGMLLYLSTNCRPDICYYVSSVARFTHNPKQSHAAAVKAICRYLKGTMCEGTIIRTSDKLSLECFCDADFAGLYNHDPPHLSSSVKSRGGYIIKLSGCPLVWKSQLMSSICLSTAEAEYYSLSIALRALMPVKRLIEEMVRMLELPFAAEVDTIHTTVHEDNQAALSLAVNQRITSRTRHYLARWHFFWEIVNDPKQNIEIVYCPTAEQEADYLTKGLDYETFVKFRKLVQGW